MYTRAHVSSEQHSLQGVSEPYSTIKTEPSALFPSDRRVMTHFSWSHGGDGGQGEDGEGVNWVLLKIHHCLWLQCGGIPGITVLDLHAQSWHTHRGFSCQARMRGGGGGSVGFGHQFCRIKMEMFQYMKKTWLSEKLRKRLDMWDYTLYHHLYATSIQKFRSTLPSYAYVLKIASPVLKGLTQSAVVQPRTIPAVL